MESSRWACILVLSGVLLLPDSQATVIELVEGNFTQYLSGVPPSTEVMVEFYASWCPHCRHFAPTYDRLGSYFMVDPAPPPVLQVARCDCANERNVCSAFAIGGYPTIKIGTAGDLQSAYKDIKSVTLLTPAITHNITDFVSQVGTLLKRSLPPIPDAPPPSPPPISKKRILRGTGTVIPTETGIQDDGAATRRVVKSAMDSLGGRADLVDIVSATRQTYREMLEGTAQLFSQRQPFFEFWTLVAAAHPVGACRLGAGDLLRFLRIWWPVGADQLWKPPKEMVTLSICRNALSEEHYRSCAGSRPDTRGYTCGLWLLFHSLAAGVEPDEGGTIWMTGIRAFIEHFFRCQECQTNFMRRLNDPSAADVVSRDDAVIWIWRSHNLVNARIAQEEHDGHFGDPKYPKIQFPSNADCSKCYDAYGAVDLPETTSYLTQWYRPLEEPSLAAPPSIQPPKSRIKRMAAYIGVSDVFLLWVMAAVGCWCCFSFCCSFRMRRGPGRRKQLHSAREVL